MKALIAVALLVGLLALGCWDAATPRESAVAVAFVHADVITMTEDAVLRDHTVLVVNGQIRAIGPPSEVSIPRTFERIDAHGKVLMPALCDMHVHLSGEAWNAVLPLRDRQAFTDAEAQQELLQYLAHGVTTVRVMSAAPEHLVLRDRIENREIAGPRLILDRMIDAPPAAYPPDLAVWVTSPDEARAAVWRAVADGYDRIKVYAYADRAVYDAICEAAADLGVPVDGHIPFDVSLEHALDSGQASVAHLSELARFADPKDAASLDEVAERFAESPCWVDSTLGVAQTLLQWFVNADLAASPEGLERLPRMTQAVWRMLAESKYLTLPESRRVEIRRRSERLERPLARRLVDAGGRLVLGSDAYAPGVVPGLSTHQELSELVAVGLTPFEVLRTATTEPFALLGERAVRGVIAVGQQTDLLLVRGDPLTDIANTGRIDGVLVRGTWWSIEELLNGHHAEDS